MEQLCPGTKQELALTLTLPAVLPPLTMFTQRLGILYLCVQPPAGDAARPGGGGWGGLFWGAMLVIAEIAQLCGSCLHRRSWLPRQQHRQQQGSRARSCLQVLAEPFAHDRKREENPGEAPFNLFPVS